MLLNHITHRVLGFYIVYQILFVHGVAVPLLSQRAAWMHGDWLAIAAERIIAAAAATEVTYMNGRGIVAAGQFVFVEEINTF